MYYLDNAATTKVNDKVVEKILKYNSEHYFNPSSVYLPAVNVRKDIENVRKNILNLLSASEHSLLFTSSATEANNTIFNTINLRIGDKVLISSSEHPSVYNTAMALKNKGIIVEVIKVKTNGQIDFDDLKSKLDDKVKLVSIMFVCNETGVIHNINKVVKIVKSFNDKILIACDGVQAFGKLDICLDLLDVDFFVLSAHKIHGPKGIGALVYKKKIKINPFIIGGGQENGFRSGTENVSGIIGLGVASEIAYKNLENNYKYVFNIKKQILKYLNESNINYILNGDVDESTPYILSISVPGIRGEVLLHMLENFDIYVSTGSACSSKHFDNRILEAMGRNKEEVMGSIRLSFNAYDEYDIEYISKKIIETILDLKGKIN